MRRNVRLAQDAEAAEARAEHAEELRARLDAKNRELQWELDLNKSNTFLLYNLFRERGGQQSDLDAYVKAHWVESNRPSGESFGEVEASARAWGRNLKADQEMGQMLQMLQQHREATGSPMRLDPTREQAYDGLAPGRRLQGARAIIPVMTRYAAGIN